MDGGVTEHSWQIKLIPIALKSLLLGVILSALGCLVLLYGAVSRPDLPFILTRFGTGMPDHLIDSTGVFVTDVTDGLTFKRWMFIDRPELREDPTGHSYLLDVDCWIIGDNIEPQSRTITFDFPDTPQDTLVRLSDPFHCPDRQYAPITVVAVYEDMVRINVCVVDAELREIFRSRIIVPCPPEVRGAAVELSNTILTDKLISPRGRQQYIATGLGLTQVSWNRLMRIPVEATDSDPDPSSRQPYGIIFAPTQQTEWSLAETIIPVPNAPVLHFASPFGWPCMTAYSGGSGQGWHTLSDTTGVTRPGDEYLLENNDLWQSLYMLSSVDRRVTRRWRANERFPGQDSPDTWQTSIEIAYSDHAKVETSSITEAIALTWPSADIDYRGVLSAIHTKSDASHTDTRRWWFEPSVKSTYTDDLGNLIEWDTVTPNLLDYGKVIYRATPFETGDHRLGFAAINDDGSAALLIQPDFFQPLTIVHLPDPAESSGDYTAFLGVLRYSDGRDAFVFATSDFEIAFHDETGALLLERPISDFFINDNEKYSAEYKINTQASASDPLVASLKSRNSACLVKVELNPDYNSTWRLLLSGAWWLLAGAWLFGSFMIFRNAREDFFLPPEAHAAAIKAEQVLKEQELDKAHGQRTLQARARLGQIADSLAHDLNSPLDAVRKNLELIRDSIRFGVNDEIDRILNDPEKRAAFYSLLARHTANPVFISLTELNRKIDAIEDFLDDNYPHLARQADSFARNGFDENSAREFIVRYGSESSAGLIAILDREASIRRSLKYSIDQVDLSLGIANRLKNLTSRKAFNIRLGIDTALQILQGELAARKISVEQDYGDVPGLIGDPLPLIESMNIILQNAIDVLPESGRIRISVGMADGMVELAIANNGPTIPDEYINKIWERGFSTGKVEGQGLGLYIARELISKSGGSIRVESGPEWTTFIIRLPIDQGAD